MLSIAIQDAEYRGEKRGEERGLKRGRIDTLADNARILMKKMNLDSSDAMDFLQITKEDRPLVMKELEKSLTKN